MSAVEAIQLVASWGSCGHASGAVGGSPRSRARPLPVRRVLGHRSAGIHDAKWSCAAYPAMSREPSWCPLAAGLVTRQQRCRIAHDAPVVATERVERACSSGRPERRVCRGSRVETMPVCPRRLPRSGRSLLWPLTIPTGSYGLPGTHGASIATHEDQQHVQPHRPVRTHRTDMSRDTRRTEAA